MVEKVRTMREAQENDMHIRRRQLGFSMLELLTVIAILGVMGGMAVMSTRDALRNERAEAALQNVLSVTRGARQLAIDRRRVFMVTYTTTTPNSMTVTVTPATNSSGGCAAATSVWPDGSSRADTVPISIQVGFQWVTGAPNTSTTAPDGITAGGGTPPPVYFTSAVMPSSICFYPDGSARDSNNAFSSGVVYLAFTTTSETNANVRLNNMRAMTIFGPTGRISGWRLTPAAAGLQWQMW